MAITRVQSTGKGHSSGAFLQVSFPSLPAAGRLIVIEAISYGNTSAITAADFSDNQGNTYQIAAAAAPNNGSATILYAQNIGSPSGTFTITWNPVPSGAAYLVMCGVEWSGMATSSVLDKSNTATGSSSAPSVSTGTTTAANELIVAVGYNDDQLASSPFTKDAAFTEDFIEQDATQYIVGEGSYRVVSATGNYTSTWSANNVPWSAAVATFKAAGGGTSAIAGTASATATVSGTLQNAGGGGGGGTVSAARYNCLLRC